MITQVSDLWAVCWSTSGGEPIVECVFAVALVDGEIQAFVTGRELSPITEVSNFFGLFRGGELDVAREAARKEGVLRAKSL